MSTSKRSTARNRVMTEAERLNAPINPTGAGEDRVIKDLLSDKFVKGTNEEASDIAMALRQLISGQSLMLQNQEKQSQEIALIKAKMREMDETAERFEADKMKFLQEIDDKADRLRTLNPDKLIANGAIMYQEALTQAKAGAVVDKMKFKEQIARMAKETVISPGELVTIMENGRPSNKIIPETVRIKDMQWVLPPGIPTEVPKVVAAALRDRRRSEKETRAREELMSKNLEQPVLAQKWAELNATYHSPTQ